MLVPPASALMPVLTSSHGPQGCTEAESVSQYQQILLFFFFLFVQYSGLLHLPPLRFHCAGMLESNPGPLQLDTDTEYNSDFNFEF
jgi:hypothetical protein